jgi:hypothetical protein
MALSTKDADPKEKGTIVPQGRWPVKSAGGEAGWPEKAGRPIYCNCMDCAAKVRRLLIVRMDGGSTCRGAKPISFIFLSIKMTA